jgi:hypothetical protein
MKYLYCEIRALLEPLFKYLGSIPLIWLPCLTGRGARIKKAMDRKYMYNSANGTEVV